MPSSTPTAPTLRPLLGSVLLLGGFLLANACSTTSQSTRSAPATRTLELAAFDSTSGAPLDSAQAINRTFGDTLQLNSAGQFVLRNVEPALHVFDVQSYGYHTRRHVSVLVEPDDTTLAESTSLLPKRLTINCQGNRPYFWSDLVDQYKEDSTRVRLQLSDVFAEDGKVRIQPLIANDLPSPVFIPENFGALGHYDVLLYDGNNNRISFRYENATQYEGRRFDGRRIYSKGDILPVVPEELERLEPNTLVVTDSIEKGTTLYARMQYTFSTDDTLRATSATTFPILNLDSLQTPVFDTLRTAGGVQVPDRLVLTQDTTIMRVVGIDTTVTRNGYTIYSTLRDENPVSTAEAARNLLYVPQPLIVESRRDSLRAAEEADTTLPEIDTAAVASTEDRSSLQVVERTNTPGLRSLLKDEQLIQSLSNGLPTPDVTPDSLLSFSETFRQAYLQTPSLRKARVRRGFDTVPDSAREDPVILSAPASDSLFQVLTPRTLAADTSLSPAQKNPFLPPDPSTRLAPEADSIALDSLRLTVAPGSDSVATDSVVMNTLHDPPTYSYWRLSPSQSRKNTSVLVVDPSFFRLRARPHVDTTATVDVAGLLPKRVGRRKQNVIRYPQQVVRAPLGTYRSAYLEEWQALQQENLLQHYCKVFSSPIRSEWRSTSMH